MDVSFIKGRGWWSDNKKVHKYFKRMVPTKDFMIVLKGEENCSNCKDVSGIPDPRMCGKQMLRTVKGLAFDPTNKLDCHNFMVSIKT